MVATSSKPLVWLLYGSYGTTGRMIVNEAARRGHRPILAGRNRARLQEQANAFAFQSVSFDLSNETAIRNVLQRVDIVVNAAGPYVATAQPMIEHCLATNTTYLDLAGELPLLPKLYAYDERARENNLLVLPSCGFDVVATDTMAALLHEELPNGDYLELAISSTSGLTSGTVKAATGVIADGGKVRSDGIVVPQKLGSEGPNIRFHHGERKTIIAPMPDLESAYRSTGIPNIRTYLALPPGMGCSRKLGPLAQRLIGLAPVRRMFNAGATSLVGDRTEDRKGDASIWGRISNSKGVIIERWMRTPEPYHFTAQAIIHAIELLQKKRPVGALTPTQAFGNRFALELSGVRLDQRLPIG